MHEACTRTRNRFDETWKYSVDVGLSRKCDVLYSTERLRECIHAYTHDNIWLQDLPNLKYEGYVYRVAEDELGADGPVEPSDVGGVPEPRVDPVRHQPVVLPFRALKSVYNYC